MSFTTLEVSELTGASLRQLQHWRERGWIPTSRSGHNQLWDERALRKAALFARVGKSGLGFMRKLARLPDAIFDRRFFLFHAVKGKDTAIPKSLVAATDERSEVIRIANAANHGIMMVELPL